MYFTERQLKIVTFIRAFIQERGISPSLDEIASNFGISKVTAHEHISALEQKGALTRVKNHARSIQLADDPRRQASAGGSSIPICGVIAAGHPIEAVADREPFDLAQLTAPERDRFLLQVRGDSMIEDGILDGDFVVIEPCKVASNGSVVVALIDGREATLKRYFLEHGRARLEPANSSMRPIYPDSLEIQGIVVGLIRNLDR